MSKLRRNPAESGAVMKDNFYEMRVYDKDMNLKYVVPPEEVKRLHIEYVRTSPQLFPAGEPKGERH